MATIGISGPLRPTTTNTPCDERTRVATEGDILNIEMPFVGMIVYCIANGKYYKITSLKSKTIGGIEIPDRLVDDYEEFGASVPIDESTLIIDEHTGKMQVALDGETLDVDEDGIKVLFDSNTLEIGPSGLQLESTLKSTVDDLAAFLNDAYDELYDALHGQNDNA